MLSGDSYWIRDQIRQTLPDKHIHFKLNYPFLLNHNFLGLLVAFNLDEIKAPQEKRCKHQTEQCLKL